MLHDLAEAYAADPLFCAESKTANFSFAEGLWWKDGGIVAPDSAATKRLILQAFHDHPLAGHMGVTKMMKAISGCFYWPLLLARDYICNCPNCWLQTTNPSKPAALLQPLEVPPHAWHTVTTEYITSLPLTPRGKSAILVFVGKLTKLVYAVDCTDTSDADDWANMYLKHVVQHQGLAFAVISDRSPSLTVPSIRPWPLA